MLRNLIFCSLCLCLNAYDAIAKKKTKGYKIITGVVTFTSEYCGGAVPSEELLSELQKEKPMVGKVLYLKLGSKNIESVKAIKRIVTDSQGKFSVKLKNGLDYIIIEEWKESPYKLPSNSDWVKWDEKCYQNWYETPDYILQRKNRNNSIHLKFVNRCSFDPYCGKYSGPLPP